MPRYYCDYCDTYLTHDSPSVRKQHNAGYKHKANVRIYYQQFEEQQTQILIDQRIKEHLGQAAALQQVGAAYAAWQRAQPPVLPTPILPLPVGPTGAPLAPGIRPPVFPRPPVLGPPVYGAPPTMAPPPGSGQPSVPTVSAPGNAPTQAPPLNTSGAAPTPSLNGGPSFSAPPQQHMYQAAPTGPNPNFGGGPNVSAPPGPPPSFPNNSGNSASMPASSTDSLPYGQAPNGNQ